MAACAACAGEAHFVVAPAPPLTAPVPLCSAACAGLLTRLVSGKPGEADLPDAVARDAAVVGERLFGGWAKLPADLRDEILGRLPVLEAVRTLRAPPGAPVWTELYARFASYVGLDPRPPSTDARSALLAVMHQYDYLIYRRTPTGLEQSALVPLRSRAAAAAATRAVHAAAFPADVSGKRNAPSRLAVFRVNATDDRIVIYNAADLFAPDGELRRQWGIPPGETVKQLLGRTTIEYRPSPTTRRTLYTLATGPGAERSEALFERILKWSEDVVAPFRLIISIALDIMDLERPVRVALDPDGPPLHDALVWVTRPGKAVIYVPMLPPTELGLRSPSSIRYWGSRRSTHVRSVTVITYQPSGGIPTSDRYVYEFAVPDPAERAKLRAAIEPWLLRVYTDTSWQSQTSLLTPIVIIDLEIKRVIQYGRYIINNRARPGIALMTTFIGSSVVTRAESVVGRIGGGYTTTPLELFSPEHPSDTSMATGRLFDTIRIQGESEIVDPDDFRRLHIDLQRAAVKAAYPDGESLSADSWNHLALIGDADTDSFELGTLYTNIDPAQPAAKNTAWWVPTLDPRPSRSSETHGVVDLVRGETPIAANAAPAAAAP